jgi:hypothetical protein
MKTLPVASFNDRASAQRLCEKFVAAQIPAFLHDESRLERLWFRSEPLAAFHVEVRPRDYLAAGRLLAAWETEPALLQQAVRCPECHSSRVEFPQVTRKFVTPALCQLLLTGLHIVPREYYCLDCHYTWPRTVTPEIERDLLGFPLNSKFWHPERFPKPAGRV